MTLITTFLFIFAMLYKPTVSVASREKITTCPPETNIRPARYFDIMTMLCQDCPENSNTTNGDIYNCVCKSSFIFTKNFGGGEVECKPCSTGLVASSDRWRCLEQTTTCSSTNIRVERNLDGSPTTSNGREAVQCRSCLSTTTPDAAGTRCEYCDEYQQTNGDSNCQCLGNARRLNGFCFNNQQLPILNNRRILLKGEDISNSPFYVEQHLQAAAVLCKAYKNTTACEALANLCIMNYGRQSESACIFYLRQDPVTDNRLLSLTDWPLDLPWIYYTDSGDNVLDRSEIPTKFIFTENHIDNQIRLVVAITTLNGTYLGIHSVRDGRLQLCPDTRERLDAAWTFGTTYFQSCDLSVAQLSDGRKYPALLFDPYIEYTTASGTFYYPVAVLITDTKAENAKDNQGDWLMVRRFFLVDNTMFRSQQGDVSIIRYVKSMVLNLNVILNSNGKIETPYLRIEYDFVRWGGNNENATVSTSFNIKYQLVTDNGGNSKFTGDFRAAIAALGVLAAVMGAVRTWTYTKRVGEANNFVVVLLKFLLFVMGSMSNLFLLVLVAISLWWIIFFKTQTEVGLLPITDSEEAMFSYVLISAFVLKLFDLCHMFYCQVKVDIFLIDWERPRSHYKDGQSQQAGKPEEAPVSAWRTYFVANEWNEIQTIRKTCPYFQLIFTILFLQVVGFINLSSKDRNSTFLPDSDSYRAPQSRMFRFAIASTIWVILAVLQWLFFTLLWERYIEDKVRQFVDLCSLANVSVFIMEHEQYGYYIHGLSPNGMSDTNMITIRQHLEREEDGLCARRGLGGENDQQTFRIALPRKVRAKYNKIYLTRNERTRSSGADKKNVERERFRQDYQANRLLTEYLTSFINRATKDTKYEIKDKIFFESLLDAEFDQVLDSGFFYNDNGHSFDQVLFYGQELTLTTFDILLFCLLDNTTSLGFIFSAFIVFFISLIVRLLRDHFGRKNLAEKTLVEKTLLI